ncbi:MAG: SDR family NAD(P)-dependent oxidoreductase [Solirubrobacteraceae bacterium]
MKAAFSAEGEVLIVTGGASGIGAAAALAYVQAGGSTVVLDVARSQRLEQAGVEQLDVDVADRDAVLAAIDGVLERRGRVDALIAGAAVQPRSPVSSLHPEVWRRTLAVNLDGVVWAVQGVIDQMRGRRSGSIVVFASGLANAGRAEASAYAASKGALIAFAKSLAAEVAADRVRVNVMFPGVIDTPQFQEANEGAEREHWLATTGIGDPDDVVGPLMFLLSDAASMTGSTLMRERAFAAAEAR